MNDANPRWQYAEGGPDNESDPDAQDPYYQQQHYGYDAFGRPLQPQQAPPRQQPPPQAQQPGYGDPYYGDRSQTYGGQQQGGQTQGGQQPDGQGGQPPWIPQQPQRPYYQQPRQPQGYDTGQQPVYQTPPGYGGGIPGQQQIYETGQQPVYDTGQHAVYDTGQQAPAYDTGQQPVYDDTGQHAPVYDTGQQPVYDTGQQAPLYDTGQQPGYQTGRQQAVPDAGRPPEPGSPNYHTEQFAFLDEESEESEEVIDWLKFSESRTERREEARRRSHNRKVGLILLVVLALLGAGGYLWQAGKIPGLGKSKAAAVASGGAQKRDVIVVHMLPVNGGPSSTALLVDNATKGRGTTVLLPNALQVGADNGTTTTLDKSVANGVAPTRDALNTLLGTDIKGSWRLDSPYLELLVDSVGDILVDTNAAVTSNGKPLVAKGPQQDLTGQAAVAYATYKGPGESETDQLARFGQVMQAVLKKLPSDAADATKTIQGLAQILDPSLTDKQLGASLAQLANLAKTGAYDTALMSVQQDGTLSAQATNGVVKDVLGGTVKQAGGTSQARVQIKDATGNSKAGDIAQAAIVNGGTYVSVPGGKAASTQALSQVLYTTPARLAAAKDVAATLGLPPSAVKQGTVPSNADIMVVLGKDYKVPSTP